MKSMVFAALCALPLIASSASDRIWDDRPGKDWESSWYPLGNGRLGCMVDGGARKLRIQFNVDTLWTGGENVSTAVNDAESGKTDATMGDYQNFGELEIELLGVADGEVSAYRRELDLSTAVYSDEFKVGKARVIRKAFASAPDDRIVFIVNSSGDMKPLDFAVRLKGAHGEQESRASGDGSSASLSGVLPNGLPYSARVDIFFHSKVQAEVVLRVKENINAG